MEKVQDLNGQWLQNNGCYRMQQRNSSQVDASFHYYHQAYPSAVVPNAFQAPWFQQWGNLAPVFNQHAAAHLQGRANGGSQTTKNDGEKDTEDPWGMVEAHAAFLGPSLWDNSDLKPRVSPTDLTKKLMEYMDLDEFLSENGIPLTETEANPSTPTSPSTSSTSGRNSEGGTRARPAAGHNKPISTADLLDTETVSSVTSSCSSMGNPVAPASVTVMPRPTASGAGKRKGRQPVVQESDEDEDDDDEDDDDDDEDVPVRKNGRKSDGKGRKVRGSSAGGRVQDVSQYNLLNVSGLPQLTHLFSPEDLALAGECFDPRSRTFSDEELRPQPMVKKSKKQYVPAEQKDDKYWNRRQKNNLAAKRSRDARRTKENQIIMRASYLEKENTVLKAQMDKMKKENASLKQRLQKYERV